MKIATLAIKQTSIIALATQEKLYLLAFKQKQYLDRHSELLKVRTRASISIGRNKIIDSIEEELNFYFSGTLKEFKTPIHYNGTPFQHLVWQALKKIPYGETRSYAEIAQAIGKPTAYRAVANANGANQLAIIIPCHRVINSNGNVGGYGGGIHNKKWLLDHEKNWSQHDKL